MKCYFSVDVSGEETLPDSVFEDDYEHLELSHAAAVQRRTNSDGTFRALTASERESLTNPIISRALLNSVDIGNCWVWMGYQNSMGYGYMSVNGRRRLLHRAVYEELRGPIPEGLVIDHLCSRPLCFRPDHLEPVTQQVNVLRTFRERRTSCRNGHEYTPENSYYIPTTGHRQCRRCNADRARKWRAELARGLR